MLCLCVLSASRGPWMSLAVCAEAAGNCNPGLAPLSDPTLFITPLCRNPTIHRHHSAGPAMHVAGPDPRFNSGLYRHVPAAPLP